MKRIFLAILVLLVSAAVMRADSVVTTEPTGTDWVYWSQLGPTFTTIANPFSFTTGPPPMPASAPTAASQNAPEMATRDEPTAFQAKVNLVMVPVVVRNAQGHAIGNLPKESFQLFDKGKSQEISRFTVEKIGAPGGRESKSSADQPAATPEEKGTPVVAPERFVAY